MSNISMYRTSQTVCLSFFLLLFMQLVQALDNGLALTPPMGWLAWERFHCNTNCKDDPHNCIRENLFMQMADIMVREGFRDAGYTYVNIDDCWLSRHRSPEGKLVADPERFPRGIRFLADYMHERGLKLGIYQDFGAFTCMGYPGIVGHMDIDAATFAEWDVDMVKLDGCHSHPKDMDRGYTLFGDLLNKTGKAMVYSCSWPYYQLVNGMEPDYKKISRHCNLWRNYHDIQISLTSILNIIDFFGDNQEVLAKHTGPGHWNDPDMIVIGNPGMTYEESKVQMSMWAILAAPLLMSNDLRDLSPACRDLLLNPYLISVNQDKLGIQGKRIFRRDWIEIWTRPIEPVKYGHYSYAIAILNRRIKSTRPTSVKVALKDLGLTSATGYKVHSVFETDRKHEYLSPDRKLVSVIRPPSLVMVYIATVLDKENTKHLIPLDSSMPKKST